MKHLKPTDKQVPEKTKLYDDKRRLEQKDKYYKSITPQIAAFDITGMYKQQEKEKKQKDIAQDLTQSETVLSGEFKGAADSTTWAMPASGSWPNASNRPLSTNNGLPTPLSLIRGYGSSPGKGNEPSSASSGLLSSHKAAATGKAVFKKSSATMGVKSAAANKNHRQISVMAQHDEAFEKEDENRKELFAQAVSTFNGFYTIKPVRADTIKSIGEATFENEEFIPAVVDGTQTLLGNTLLKLRLGADVVIDGVAFLRNTRFTGRANVSQRSIHVSITRLQTMPVDFMVYDRDFNAGIILDTKKAVVEGAINESSNDLADDLLEDVPYGSVAKMGRNLLKGKKQKERAVTLSDGYGLYIVRSKK